MKKPLMLVAATGALTAAMVPGVASACVDACPPGGNWELVPLSATMPEYDAGNFFDQNGDGYVCMFSNPNKNASGIPDWIVKDNVKPIETVKETIK